MPEVRTTALPAYVELSEGLIAVTALPAYVELSGGDCRATTVVAYVELGELEVTGGAAGDGLPEMIGPYRAVRLWGR